MDKSKLLAKRGGTRDVDIDGVGTVTIKSLTRAEVKACQHDDRMTQDSNIIAAAMVDPQLTVEEVCQWLDNAPAGEAVTITQAIAELSGMSEGAQFRGIPRA